MSQLQKAEYERAWMHRGELTPRQACALVTVMDAWADGDIREWIEAPTEPLHAVGPFAYFDRRVLFHVAESRAWAEAFRERLVVVSDEIQLGVLPFTRPGPFSDELVVAAALLEAPALLLRAPELFSSITARASSDSSSDSDFEEPDVEIFFVGDEYWDMVADGFDDLSEGDEWQVPVMPGHVLLPAVLRDRHPFTWFDEVPATGSGYLQQLSGIATVTAQNRASDRPVLR